MANILGTAGNDTLTGTVEADRIEGLAGADNLAGGAGDDVLLGGADSDTLEGGDGDDVLEGGDAYDRLNGGAGNDIIRGGEGNDLVDSQYETGSDEIHGDGGNDSLWVTRSERSRTDAVSIFGGDGDDEITAQFQYRNAGAIDAGAGADKVYLSSETTTLLTLGLGRDVLTLGHNLSGEVVIADFEAGPAGDRIEWDDFLNHRLVGWDKASNPFATGHLKLVQSGADALLLIDHDAGGASFAPATLIRFRNLDASTLTPGNLDGYPSDGSTPAGANIQGTAGNDVLMGAGGPDVIEGLGGNDRLTGAAGDDTLRGGDGDDSLFGDAGDDLLEGGVGRDSLAGGAGDDRVFGGEGDDYIQDRDGGSDMLSGGGGSDYFEISRYLNQPAAEVVTVDGGDGGDYVNAYLYGQQTIRVDAGAGDDQVRISANTEALVTLGAGRDTLQFDGGFGATLKFVVTDFEAGPTGDRLDWDDYLGQRLENWDANGNPFATGHLRLSQVGADTVISFDRDGSGAAHAAATLITLQDLDASTLTAENLDGFPADGSIPEGAYIAGTSGFDRIEGTGGADVIEGFGSADFLNGGANADTLRGGDGNDQIDGELGDDLIEGGEGDDYLEGGFGSDRVYGGAGNDSFSENRTGGFDQLFGEGGDDQFFLYNYYDAPGAAQTTLSGGDGNDRVNAGLGSGHSLVADLGAGDDYVTLSNSEATTLTLGSGRDLYELHLYYYQNATTLITDFEVGPTGDRLEFSRLLGEVIPNWDGVANPFASGHLRLSERGGDTLLLLDADAGLYGDPDRTLILFRGVAAADLAPDNLDGFDPFTMRGTIGADDLTGTAGRDRIAGGAGDDFFLLQGGGDDSALGGAGDDGFYFGAALTAADRADGGDGADDQVALQGDYAGLTLGAGNLLGVETLVLLSGADARFGDASGATYGYNLTAVDANVAAGGFLTVNMNTLRSGENVTFNGAAEKDGEYLFFGGAGSETLIGGARSDAFYFGTGLFGSGDRLTGGAGGDDQLGLQGDYAGANALTFGAAQLTGVESIVLLSGADNRFGGGAGSSFSYDLTLNNGNAAAGATLTINGNTLRGDETLRVNGAAELDGTLRLFGGNGADALTGGRQADAIFGGAGDDRIAGGLGADALTGGAGADVFAYGAAAERIR